MGEFLRLVVATLLGAAITFVTTIYVERRRETSARREDRERADRDLRRASRLVFAELVDISSDLTMVLDKRGPARWWSTPPADLPRDAWLEYRGTLARAIEDEGVWDDLYIAYSQVRRLNEQLRTHRSGEWVEGEVGELEPYAGRGTTLGIQVSDNWQKELRLFLGPVESAIEALRPLARPSTSVNE